MRTASQLPNVIAAILVPALLAGCAGSSEGPPGAVRPLQSHRSATALFLAGGTRISPRTGAVGVKPAPPWGRVRTKRFFSPAALAPEGAMGFVSDLNGAVVYIVNAQGATTATLTGFESPEGMSTDGAGNLYVANNSGASISELAPPYNGTPKVLDDPDQFPTDVAVDSSGDVAAVSGINTSDGPGQIAFYAPGATSPTKTIAGSPAFHTYSCAFDAAGNLYVYGLDPNTGAPLVGEVIGGISGSSISPLSYDNTILASGGVQITLDGDIALADQLGAAIYTYKPPSGGSLGSPIQTTPLGGGADPLGFALSRHNHVAVTASVGLGQAEKYAYPDGGAPLATSNFPVGTAPGGAAINPTGQYAQL